MTSAKKKILIVDDDPDIRLQVDAVLQKEGYAVHAACDAAEAEEMLLSLHPDLAVVDLMMERKDSGFVLCHRIRQLYPGTPVIMLTAVKASTGLTFPAAPGAENPWLKADLLLDKPVRAEQLAAAVRRLLTRAEANGEA